MLTLNTSISCRSLTLCALGALLGASALAAGSHDSSSAQAQYLQDRAACNAGQSNEDRATCLKEAGAALQAARRGGLTSTSPTEYQRNALLRCNEQPPENRDDCVARMQSPAQGDVGAGGLLREAETPAK
ncbi:hypothetical protein [Polaromonas sp. C04]|uniref:hypothetical protein n=1 Tax=Polaromonas sp. C04 TaxID=1945857 RepID=UPI00157C4E6A|nr:hypothetical protein [Polaromonas sp. C04]